MYPKEVRLRQYEERKKLKKAIRSTHRGSMGDPMRPTTRIKQ